MPHDWSARLRALLESPPPTSSASLGTRIRAQHRGEACAERFAQSLQALMARDARNDAILAAHLHATGGTLDWARLEPMLEHTHSPNPGRMH